MKLEKKFKIIFCKSSQTLGKAYFGPKENFRKRKTFHSGVKETQLNPWEVFGGSKRGVQKSTFVPKNRKEQSP